MNFEELHLVISIMCISSNKKKDVSLARYKGNFIWHSVVYYIAGITYFFVHDIYGFPIHQVFLLQQSASLIYIYTFYQTKGLLIKFNVYVSKRLKQFLQLLQNIQTYSQCPTQICLCSNKSLKWRNRATWISYTCHLKRFFSYGY